MQAASLLYIYNYLYICDYLYIGYLIHTVRAAGAPACVILYAQLSQPGGRTRRPGMSAYSTVEYLP